MEWSRQERIFNLKGALFLEHKVLPLTKESFLAQVSHHKCLCWNEKNLSVTVDLKA